MRGMAQQTWLGNKTNNIWQTPNNEVHTFCFYAWWTNTHTLIISSARVRRWRALKRHLVDKLWLFFPTMLSIRHLEMICQCGIIWSRFICWETIKCFCQYLMWTMAFSMIGARPHLDSLLMSAMWFGPLSFSHHWTQIFHLILPLAYSLACMLTAYALSRRGMGHSIKEA
jgi:hypothetical protein